MGRAGIENEEQQLLRARVKVRERRIAELRTELVEAGLERSVRYDWRRSAKAAADFLDQAG